MFPIQGKSLTVNECTGKDKESWMKTIRAQGGAWKFFLGKGENEIKDIAFLKAEGLAIDRLKKECILPHRNVRFVERCYEKKLFGDYVAYARASVKHSECDQTRAAKGSRGRKIASLELLSVHDKYINLLNEEKCRDREDKEQCLKEIELSWYRKLTNKKNSVLGYGQGEDLDEAIDNALLEISKVVGNKVDKHETSILKKTEVAETWYIALSYKNISFVEKFVSLVKKISCSKQKQNLFLSKSPLIVELNDRLKCKHDYKLRRRNLGWYLVLKNKELFLPQYEFNKLFIGKVNKAVSISTSKSKLEEGDSFNIKVKSKGGGFVSLFNIYETGEVFYIYKNRKVSSGKEIRYPEGKSNKDLVAGLLIPGEPTQDMYLVLQTKEKVGLDRFDQAGSEVNKSERNKKFDEFIKLLGKKDFASTIIKIDPN